MKTKEPPILKAEGLSVGYGPRTVLEGVAFELAKGEVLAVIGQNGGGKSTLMKALGGLIPLKSGRIAVGGDKKAAMVPHRLIASGISLFTQGGLVMPALTVEEHLALAVTRGVHTRPAYEHFPRLHELRKQRAGSLSGGERQMLSFGILIEQGTSTWLLDEPTAGLSPEMVAFTTDFLRKKNREEGVTMLLVEHNMEVAFALADHVVVAKEGTLTRKFGREEFRQADFLTRHVFN